MTSNRRVVFGARGSALSVAQTRQVMAKWTSQFPDDEIELRTFTTTGDRIQDREVKPADLHKGIFTKEIEHSLLQEEIDIAVHSAKDLSVWKPQGLVLGAVPERHSPHDVLLSKEAIDSLEEWSVETMIMTSSPRRVFQWKEHYPNSTVVPVRGNVQTRIQKLIDHGEAHASILAQAGMDRLQPDLLGCSMIPLPLKQFIPAPGQGALALQARETDQFILNKLAAIEHMPSRRCLDAERRLVQTLEAGCSVPLGAFAYEEDEQIFMPAILYLEGMKLGDAGRRASASTAFENDGSWIETMAEQLKA